MREVLVAGCVGLAFLVGLSGLVVGQDPQPPEAAPEVRIENASIDGRIVPLDEPGQTTLTVQVGCDVQETVGTQTLLFLAPADNPEWSNVVVSPSVLTWNTGAGDCPSTQPPFEGEVSVSISLTQDAPAYQDTSLTLQANVSKSPPEVDRNRSYGPYETSVTFTPGYFHQHNVRMEEKIVDAGAGENATFTGEIDNFSNHETRFVLSAANPPEGATVTLDPSSLVVPRGGTGTFEVRVGLDDPGGFFDGEVTAQVQIEGASTGPPGETGSSTVSVLAKFQRPDVGDPRDAPMPGTAVLAAALATLALAARR